MANEKEKDQVDIMVICKGCAPRCMIKVIIMEIWNKII